MGTAQISLLTSLDSLHDCAQSWSAASVALIVQEALLQFKLFEYFFELLIKPRLSRSWVDESDLLAVCKLQRG